jgi:hypothetical protein
MVRKIVYLLAWVLFLASCGSNTDSSNGKAAANEKLKSSASKNYLSMKIDGVEWVADNSIFAAFHPKGYNNAIMIAGSKGPKNKDEQLFSLNLFNTTGAAVYEIKEGGADLNVAQLANLSPEHYLYGSLLGFNMKINVSRASTNPDIIEATFEGELTGNASDKIRITEGKFYFHE